MLDPLALGRFRKAEYDTRWSAVYDAEQQTVTVAELVPRVKDMVRGLDIHWSVASEFRSRRRVCYLEFHRSARIGNPQDISRCSV
jgi:hypothetical protein